MTELLIEVGVFATIAAGMALAWMDAWRRSTEAETALAAGRPLTALGEHTVDVAHDLGRVLMAAQGSIAALDDLDRAEREAAIGGLSEAVGAAIDLAQSVVDVASKAPVQGDALSIAEMCARIFRAELTLMPGARLMFTGLPGDAFVAISNLVTNAVRHATRTGARARVVAGRNVLVIVNTASNSDLDWIAAADPWTRAESGVGSSGRGLALVQRAAGRLGWTVQLEVDRVCGTVTATIRA